MPSSPTPVLRAAAALVLLAGMLPAIPALAQSDSAGAKAVGVAPSHKPRHKGTANQPAPAAHQPVQPSQKLQDEPNQVKEQVAPVPDAPVKPGSTVSSGQDTPKPQRN